MSNESKMCGDAAKLREALVQVQKKINYLIGNLTVPNSLVANRMEINGIINAALAAPPRNCDVIGNTGRALVVHGFPTKSKPWGEGEWLKLIDWLFAPATEKEGGNDENE